MDIGVIGTVYQLFRRDFYTQIKVIFQKNKVVRGKTLFLLMILFCACYSIYLNLIFTF